LLLVLTLKEIEQLNRQLFQKDAEIRSKSDRIAELESEVQLTRTELRVQENALVEMVERCIKLQFQLEDNQEELNKVMPGTL
jgi:hypothetical protein